MTLGIFLKMFNVFDQACRRLDYRLTHNEDDEEEVMNELFFREGKIFDFKESLAVCRESYLTQISALNDEDNLIRESLEKTFMEHRDKVENVIEKLVRNLDFTFSEDHY